MKPYKATHHTLSTPEERKRFIDFLRERGEEVADDDDE